MWQESTIVINPVMDVVQRTFLSAFSFLTALSMRDVFHRTLEAVLPAQSHDKLVFTFFYAAVIIFITVLLSYLWRDTITPSAK
jgi:hypothetical protein